MEMERLIDSPMNGSTPQGTAFDGPVGDLTLKEFVLINPPKIPSYVRRL